MLLMGLDQPWKHRPVQVASERVQKIFKCKTYEQASATPLLLVSRLTGFYFSLPTNPVFLLPIGALG